MASSSTAVPAGPPRSLSRRMTRAQTMVVDFPDGDSSAIDSELVPSSLASFVPILRVANDIETDNPRVAYLCRFHAFDKAHKMDPSSSGRGVRQFKTYLLHRLEKEDVETRPLVATNDPREIMSYYQKFYEDKIREGEYTKKPEEMAKVLQIASVLYDVLKTVVPPGRIGDQIKNYAKDVEAKREQYEHYNILPLYATGLKPAIMELPEIKSALHALHKVDNLPMPRATPRQDTPANLSMERTKSANDILDWLSSIFGFQRGNVANQREHLILLLANLDVRDKNLESYSEISSLTVEELAEKIFKNYRSWYNYLHIEPNLRYPAGCDKQQLMLIYIALYLLVWGEASNLRFMPECLCYIFHNMAGKVHEILSGVGATYDAAPDDETFLRTVITPIYQVLQKVQEMLSDKMATESQSRFFCLF